MNDRLRAVWAIVRLALRERATTWVATQATRAAHKVRDTIDALRNGGVGPRK